MRIPFLLALLAGAVFYTYIAFVDLPFLTRSGRLGPGFFPRIIGIGMVGMTLWILLDELRHRSPDASTATQWRDVVLLMALAVGYAVMLRLFGGFFATLIYLAVTLSILNRGQHVKNATVSVLVPGGVYLLFDRILNANMPPALFTLPI